LISNPNDFILEEAMQSPKEFFFKVILRILQIIAYNYFFNLVAYDMRVRPLSQVLDSDVEKTGLERV